MSGDQLDQCLELRRLWPRRMDQPPVAARRGRGLRSRSGSYRQRVPGYTDSAVAFNPFDATIATGTDRTSLVKISGQWTHLYGSNIETNINGGWVQSFAGHSGIVATVTGNGHGGADHGQPGLVRIWRPPRLPRAEGLDRRSLRQRHAGPAAGRQHHPRRRRAADQLLGRGSAQRHSAVRPRLDRGIQYAAASP